MSPRPLLAASRKELNQIALDVKEGTVPTDLQGFVFINSAVGTVNTNGLPYTERYSDGSIAQEYSTPVINGDGLILKFDLTKKGQVLLSTGLMRTPCYYADEATMRGTVWHKKYGFMNLGLARISIKMGTRNQINTAVQPVKFGNDKHTRLLATFDAGRPFEFDPHTLNLITPIGANKEWRGGTPPFMRQPFAMVLTTAHPVFDPRTRELFTVNFTKTDEALMASTTIFSWLETDPDGLEERIRNFMRIVEKENLSREDFLTRAAGFIRGLENKYIPQNSVWEKIWNWLKAKILGKIDSSISNKNAVYLMRWNGQGAMQQWEVTDQDGNGLLIDQNMHQIGFSEDYIILIDAAFKFSLDVMLYNVFPDKEDIDAFMRKLTSGVQQDSTDIYLVHRADLRPDVKHVKAKKIVIPIETVHFSVNYKNPYGIITMFSAHNCSACPAEWIRSYDREAVNPQQPIRKDKVGLLAVGAMDVGQVGRIVMDAKNGTYLADHSKYYYNTNNREAHTWGIGLYTHRDMCSADNTTDDITHMYWQSYGLRPDMLTVFIRNLYDDPKRNRKVPVPEVLEATRQGSQYTLFCLETAGMTVDDFYTFDKETYFWSLQFVPRSEPRSDIPPYKDGYILTTVSVGYPLSDGTYDYQPEIWIFDATALAKGPVCKLNHPDMSFGFTIHTVWVPDAQPNTNPDYVINIREDYDYMLGKIRNKQIRQEISQIFNQYVYPNF
ncbi:carotenoid oxygenase family protein [Rhodoflexus caldus]|uniref:carotenoid oxygenase family protein n=1 Tax=Rhodoflexus caldus TaxID=2891236 RepID=UPI002029FDA4|nr:carotenoid oxygenase family protein [Rhodoflexus caldus]